MDDNAFDDEEDFRSDEEEEEGEDQSVTGAAHEFGKFFGVYLLYCQNPKTLGRTYIGFTVNPNRRVRQHNAGRYAGGAKSTAGKGPWDMTLIVHGFPSKIAALQFEWAWQNPLKSRRVRTNAPSRQRSESAFDHKVRLLCAMLRCPAWRRLPLVLRWLKQEFSRPLPADLQPPAHMSICYGPVLRVNKAEGEAAGRGEAGAERPAPACHLCTEQVEAAQRLRCPVPSCRSSFHLFCLAACFLRTEPLQLLPVEGACPQCRTELLWGDLIAQSARRSPISQSAAPDEPM